MSEIYYELSEGEGSSKRSPHRFSMDDYIDDSKSYRMIEKFMEETIRWKEQVGRDYFTDFCDIDESVVSDIEAVLEDEGVLEIHYREDNS